MDIDLLFQKFSKTAPDQQKAIFNSLFILTNRLQTLFDSRIPDITLKQFMLLSLVRQSENPQTLSQLGNLLGCSRQNVKKLADVLQKKDFVIVSKSPKDVRAMQICLSEKGEDFFHHDFVKYQEELKYLFEVYTDEELECLFRLISKLYKGIENLEHKTSI